MVADIVDRVRDAVHDELLVVASSLRPHSSDASTKHAPDPVLINLIVTQVLVPVLTSVGAGLLTHLATHESEQPAANLEREVARLHQEIDELKRAKAGAETEQAVDAALRALAAIPLAQRTPADEVEIVASVSAILHNHGLSEASSGRAAKQLTRGALDAIWKERPDT